jgi:hypothetical protein
MKMNSTKSKIQESLVGAWTLVEWSEQQSNGPKCPSRKFLNRRNRL